MGRARFPALATVLALTLAGTVAAPTAAGAQAAAPAAEAPARLAPLARPTSFTLDNGLEVIVIEDHRAPIVTHMVWYRAGAADDPPGKSGIAHFLEHLMFKGTERNPAGRFDRLLAQNGGRGNAFTTHDYTCYHQSIAKDRLGLVMELEADRMRNLALTAEAVEPERDVILEERRSRVDNDPGAQFNEQLAAAQFLAHPYRVPVIGWAGEMARLGRADAEAFYDTHYAPNNAILVVAGDVAPAEVEALARKHYGPVPKRDIAPRDWQEEPPQRAARRLVMTDARVREPSWTQGWLAPGYVWGDTARAPALDVLAQILGGGPTSRLYRALVVEQGIAANAGAAYGGTNRGPSTFDVWATPRGGAGVPAVETAVAREIARIQAEGVTEAELARAKRTLIANLVYARDDRDTMARIFGASRAVGMTVDDVMAWPGRIEAVDAAAVKAAAQAVLVPETSVTGELRPKPAS
jgi:zinc protease